MSKETTSLEAALKKARAHVDVDHDSKSKFNVTNTSKYAQKRMRNSKVSNGSVTTTVSKEEAVEALVYSGNVKYNDKGIVVDELDVTKYMYYPSSFEATTVVLEQNWMTDEDIIGVVGKSPKFVRNNDGEMKYDGILKQPFLGNYPTPSEERRSRKDIRKIASINRYVERKRVTTTIRAEEINGVLPCWQTRETHGEAEPFMMDSGQCTSCAFAVMGYSDSYCDDAIALSANRHSESQAQRQALFHDGTVKLVDKLREELAMTWLVIEKDIQFRYEFELKCAKIFGYDAPGFMKYKKSIIDEYAEVSAKVKKVETALEYAEYILN